MNLQGTVPVRYITTPTLQEIYQEDSDSYDALSEEGAMIELSNENDRVKGTESLYGYILNNRKMPAPDWGEVTGNEGFMDTVKKKMGNFIQMVRDFFKWVWSFFGSKQKRAELRATKFKRDLKEGNVKDGDIKYPGSVIVIYPDNRKPDNNLSWMKKTNENISKGIDKTEGFISLLNDFLSKLKERLSGEDFLVQVTNSIKAFEDDRDKLLGLNDKKVGTLIAPNDIHTTNGVIARGNRGLDRKLFKDATFKTSLSEIQTFEKEYSFLVDKLGTLTKNVAKVEAKIIETLNKVVAVQEKVKGAFDIMIRDTIRIAMVYIKVLEIFVFYANKAVGDIIAASIK